MNSWARRTVVLILSVILIASLLSGCVSAADDAVSGAGSIQTFRDIPGITSEEVEAIEELLATRDSFSIGALFSTYAFILPDGSLAGFFPLLSELLTDLFGVPFTIDFYDWDVLNEKLNEYSMDFTGELTATPERRLSYFMTSPIAELALAAYINADTTEIANAQSLSGLTVAFWSQSITEHYVRLAYPDVDFISVGVDSEAEVAEKLLSGEINAFIAPAVDAYVFKEYPFILAREVFPLIYADASFTTANKELEPIITAIDKYLAAGDGFFQIHDLHVEGRRSFAAYTLMNSLTDAEKEYINYIRQNDVKVPIIMETSLYPVTFYNRTNGEFQGIVQDILTEINLLTGISFEVINDSRASWNELLDMLSAGHAAMIADLWYSEELSNKFLWSDQPYMVSNYAFLSRTETPYTDFLIPILRTGVVKGTVFESIYHTFYPDGGNLILFDSNTDVLNAFESDEIDLMLTAEFLLLYQTNYREKPGFKVNILLDYLTGESFFGFNKEQEQLRSIISKAQRFVDTERIVLSWTGRVFDYERRLADERADDANLRAVTLLISISLLLLLLIVLAILLRKNRVMLKELQSTSAVLEVALVESNAASKAKSDFLSNMSHEIRTPLNAIVGMTAIAKKTKDLEEKDQALGEVEDASSHLLGIINDVLDMAKIEAGKLELSPTNFMFEKMLQKVLSTVYFKANEKEHEIIIDVDSKIPRFILGDEQRLAQIIMNLLTNAVKFTPIGGKINLKAILIEQKKDKLTLQIEVNDSGIGISPVQQEKLFDAFEQANTDVNRDYGGTGLGLAIAKRIAEMMGGQIWLVSELGKGARFIFTIQVLVGSKEGSELAKKIDDDKNIGAFEGKRLLVVEDVELNSRILVALLENTGLTIKCVENGKEALEEIESNPDEYDIIFMDLQMPVMNGLEATRRIRALPGHREDKLPIIAMTANVFKEDIESCINAGMNDHLSKPLDIEVVMKALHMYLGV